MFSEGRLVRPDFEPHRKRAREITFGENPEDTYKKSDSIPHSSLRIRLKELVERYSVEQIPTNRNSKRGDPIPSYNITFLGLVELLRLSSGKEFSSEFWNKIRYHTPIRFHVILDSLEEILSKENLFHTLTLVCENTVLSVLYHPPITENSSDFSQYEWIQYFIGIRFSHFESTYSITDKITIHGIKNKQQLSNKKRRNSVLRIWTLMMCVFFHELIMGNLNFEESKKYYHVNNSGCLLLDIIKNDNMMKKEYLKFLDNIDETLRVQGELTDNIRSHFVN